MGKRSYENEKSYIFHIQKVIQDKCFEKYNTALFFFIFRSRNRRLWKSVGVC